MSPGYGAIQIYYYYYYNRVSRCLVLEGETDSRDMAVFHLSFMYTGWGVQDKFVNGGINGHYQIIKSSKDAAKSSAFLIESFSCRR